MAETKVIVAPNSPSALAKARISADRAAPAESKEQEVSRYDRRQHEREMHDAVEHGAAGKAPARQRAGRRYGEGQACGLPRPTRP
jgi:hypothetical protein